MAVCQTISTRRRRSATAELEERTLRARDVAKVTAADLPVHADLAWESFPCQDPCRRSRRRRAQRATVRDVVALLELMKTLSVDNRATRMTFWERLQRAHLACRQGFCGYRRCALQRLVSVRRLGDRRPALRLAISPALVHYCVHARSGPITDDPAFDRDMTGNRQFTNDLRPDRGFPTSAPTNAAAWIGGI